MTVWLIRALLICTALISRLSLLQSGHLCAFAGAHTHTRTHRHSRKCVCFPALTQCHCVIKVSHFLEGVNDTTAIIYGALSNFHPSLTFVSRPAPHCSASGLNFSPPVPLKKFSRVGMFPTLAFLAGVLVLDLKAFPPPAKRESSREMLSLRSEILSAGRSTSVG